MKTCVSIARRQIWNFVSIIVVLTTVVAAVSTQAATVTSANDYPSTLQSGQSADHRVVFTTPSGVSEGQTITVSFSAAFDTASIIEDDVDLADDAADLTTASDCSGAEQASATMAADTLTFLICAGDGGAIAAGSVVTVEIGLNATASGSGSNRVVNPLAAGTAFVSLAGTFGDSGSIALPIGADDSLPVSAVVTSGGGGGGGPPPPSDTTPPAISSIMVSDLTGTSATVTWNTDESSDSQVDYGETVSYEIGTVTDTGMVYSHSVSLSGLLPGRLYHFRVRSADGSSNEAVSGDYSFTTLDTLAPVISDLQVVDLTTSSARVTWTTDEAASSFVDFGLTGIYGSTVADSGLVTGHSLVLTGLNDGTPYHYRVRSVDASSNQAVSGDRTFSTVANLPPANVSGFAVVAGDAQNSLSWVNPTDADFSGVRILSCLSASPVSPVDPACSVVYEDSDPSFVHINLTNGRTYYYGAFPYDAVGQFASGALGSGTPSAPEEELPPKEGEEPPLVTEEEQPPAPPGQEAGFCGDGQCSQYESPESCPADCQGIPPAGPVCGDAVCAEDEDDRTCPADCPLGLPSQALLQGNLEFFVAANSVRLTPTNSGVVRVLAESPIRVQLLNRGLNLSVQRVQLSVGQESFLMAPNFHAGGSGDYNLRFASIGDDAFVADFVTPDEPGQYPLTITLVYDDESSQSVSTVLQTLGYGYLFTSVEGATKRVGSATVTLFVKNGQLTAWDGSPHGQLNPFSTKADGAFAWYVPQNGTYVVRADASGYTSVETTVSVVDNIVNPAIQISSTLLPVVPEGTTEEEGAAVPSPLQTIAAVSAGLQTVRELPGVQSVAVASVPVLAVSAAASGLILSLSFNFLPFIQYLFTAPVLFLGRRKRKGFGIVYHAITKTPVDLAIVRLYQLSVDAGGPGRLVRSRVTDQGGRYFFMVQPGQYRIAVAKSGFTFPTDYLKDVKKDIEFLDVYHGEPITVTEHDAVITANIPLDPIAADERQAPAKVVWLARLRHLQNVIALSGVIVSIVFAILRPTMLAAAMVVIQLLVYLLARRLSTARKPKSWGIVYDKRTNRPLAKVVARIFEPKYNKLLETAVTDAHGRYSFLLGPNEYFAVFEKDGYVAAELRPVDYRGNKEPVELSVKIGLSPSA